SATVRLQLWQAAPAAAQALAVVGLTQLGPLQQPLGQRVALQPVQTPASQLPPSPQLPQAPPPEPHCESESLVTQTSPWQQPLAQLDGLQVHLLERQVWPASHAGEQPAPPTRSTTA